MHSRSAAAEITPVLVTYNSAAILPWSLPSLSACRSVVIVDNCSRDDSVEVARRLLPQATIIRSERNVGFGRANNRGLAAVTTPYALLMNPDGRLLENSLTALHEGAKRYPDAAMLAPVLFDAPGQVGDFYRGTFDRPACKPTPQPVGDLCCDFVTGAAMLLDMHRMRDVGFFDPWFFLYCEDDDLCLRVRRAGHSIIVLADAAFEHKTRQSSTPSLRNTWRRSYCMTLSKFYLTRKYFGAGRCALLVLRVGLGSLLSLPIQVLGMRREAAMKQAARAGAALLAFRHLRRAHCFEPAR